MYHCTYLECDGCEQFYLQNYKASCMTKKDKLHPKCDVCQGWLTLMSMKQVLAEKNRNKKCYTFQIGDNEPETAAVCDCCNRRITTPKWYHCDNIWTRAHLYGRDLCVSCGVKVYMDQNPEEYREEFENMYSEI